MSAREILEAASLGYRVIVDAPHVTQRAILDEMRAICGDADGARWYVAHGRMRVQFPGTEVLFVTGARGGLRGHAADVVFTTAPSIDAALVVNRSAAPNPIRMLTTGDDDDD